MSDDRVFTKCAWRLLPVVCGAYLLNYLDRTNLAFAALTMNRDLGFSPSVYGLGAGIFFLSYSILMVPSNLMLHRVGARRWIALLLVTWGAAATANAAIAGTESFYALRLLLGVAEAGFFPGIIFYLTLWFPKPWIGRANGFFICAGTGSLVIGGPIASAILMLDGVAGLVGWQWLFLLEGVPACIMAFAVLKLLPDGPRDAPWLDSAEIHVIAAQLDAEGSAKQKNGVRAVRDVRVIMLGIAYAGLLFATYGLQFWLPLLVQGMGFSNTANGLIVGLVYAASLPFVLLWARSSDRWGDRIWHVAVGALFCASALLVAAVVPSTVVALLALAAAAMAIQSSLAPFYAISSLFLSGRAMAAGYALVNTAGNLLGGFGGQYVIGLIRQQTGGYSAALAVIAASVVLSAILVVLVGRSLSPRRVPIMAPAE